MELQKQVISLPLAKRLKELSVKQEALYYWQQIGIRKGTLVQNRNTGHFDTNEVTEWYAAFTVAELGEILLNTHNVRFFRANAGEGMEWVAMTDFHREYANTEAEARGLMLAYLIENGLLNLS